jgi:hypothetical protein
MRRDWAEVLIESRIVALAKAKRDRDNAMRALGFATSRGEQIAELRSALLFAEISLMGAVDATTEAFAVIAQEREEAAHG